MSDTLKPLIGIAADRPLTRNEAETAFATLFDGEATPSQIGGLLIALRTRGETVDEYAAAAAVKDRLWLSLRRRRFRRRLLLRRPSRPPPSNKSG